MGATNRVSRVFSSKVAFACWTKADMARLRDPPQFIYPQRAGYVRSVDVPKSTWHRLWFSGGAVAVEFSRPCSLAKDFVSAPHSLCPLLLRVSASRSGLSTL